MDINVGTDTNPEQINEGSNQTFVVSDKTVYHSVDDLYKGAIEKEKFIGELVSKVKTLEEQLKLNENKANLEEGLTKMIDALEHNNGNNQEPTSPADINTIEKIAAQVFQKQQEEHEKSTNVSFVENRINSYFGESSKEKLEAKLKSLNMNQEEFINLAATKPQVALKLIDVDASAPKVNMENLYTKAVTPQINTASKPNSLYEELKIHGTDPRWMANKFEEALKDPSILSDLVWNSYGK